MSKPVPATEIDLEFADGSYTFKLGLAQIAELQTKANCGIGQLYARVIRGRYLLDGKAIGNPLEAEYYMADLVESIRQGLIGGAKGVVDGLPTEVTPAIANRLIANYVYPVRPIAEAWGMAASILATAIEGYVAPDKKKEDQPAKVTAGSTTRKRSRTAR